MTELLTGPYGGMMAMAFGLGAVSGWGFAMKTALAEARKRLDELKRELSEARQEAIEMREKYLARLEQVGNGAG